MDEKLLNSSALAERWLLATKTIQKRMSDGDDMPKSLLIGRSRRFRLKDVIEWEKEHEN